MCCLDKELTKGTKNQVERRPQHIILGEAGEWEMMETLE